jgi:hypothetical protein
VARGAARILAALILWMILPFWSVLYPLAAAPALAVGMTVFLVTGNVDPTLDLPARFAMASLAFLVSALPVSRSIIGSQANGASTACSATSRGSCSLAHSSIFPLRKTQRFRQR